MPDKRSKDNDNQEIADYQQEESVFKNTSDADQKFDHLQELFDAALATTTPASSNTSVAEPYGEAGDAFNDLANAFAVESTAADEHNTSASHLEQPSAELKSPTLQSKAQETTNNDDFDLPDWHESSKPEAYSDDFDLSHLHEDSKIEQPMSPSADTAATAAESEADFNALHESETPVYADLSTAKTHNQRPTGQIIAFSTALLLTIAGGLVWYTSDSDEPVGTNIQTANVQNDVLQPSSHNVATPIEPTPVTPSKTTTQAVSTSILSKEQTNLKQPALKKSASQASAIVVVNNIIQTSPDKKSTPAINRNTAAKQLKPAQQDKTPHQTDPVQLLVVHPSSPAQASDIQASDIQASDIQTSNIQISNIQTLDSATSTRLQKSKPQPETAAVQSLVVRPLISEQASKPTAKKTTIATAASIAPQHAKNKANTAAKQLKPAQQDKTLRQTDPVQLLVVHPSSPAQASDIQTLARTTSTKLQNSKPQPETSAVQSLVVHPLISEQTSKPTAKTTTIATATSIAPQHAENKHQKSTPTSKPAQRLIVQPITLSQGTVKQQTSELSAVNIAPQPSPTHLAVIQPTTPVTPVHTVKSTPAEDWILLVPATSNKTARQYMARFKALHLDSKIIQVQGNGQIHHFIQIKGFNSQQAAQQQRDTLLNKMGFKHVEVNQL